MLTRIAVALGALYLVSNGQTVPGDVAVQAGSEAARIAVRYCADHPETCRKALGAAAGVTTGAVPTQAATSPLPEAVPATLPVPVQAYPLPPRRPDGKRA